MATAVIHTLKASAGDYSLMSTWEATEQRDLVTLDETETLECYNDFGGPLVDNVSIAGWVTGFDNWIAVEAAPGQSHGGVIGAGFTLTSAASVGTMQIGSDVPYTYVRGIEIRNTHGGTSNNRAIRFNGTPRLEGQFDSLILTAPGNYGLYIANAGTSDGVVTVRNILAHNCLWGMRIRRYMSVKSCTTIDCVNGFENIETNPDFYDTIVMNNCVGYGGVPFPDVVRWGASSRNNASSDAVAPGASAQLNITTADFSDFAGGDYSPASGGKLDGTGADLSATFDYDIAGATRTAPWTIGAYIVAGGPPPVGIQEMYIKDGGIFVKYTPYVKVGGTFQEVDAYVLEGGAWVPVHEK